MNATATVERFRRRGSRAGTSHDRVKPPAAAPDGFDAPAAALPLDRARYFSVVRFFAGLFISIVWWDLILRRVPGLGSLVLRTRMARWRRSAQRYRGLALRLGGVLIKLGQFLSIRVDILPPAVTTELAGLQDEVPAETLADVQAVVAAEFGRPTHEVFAWFSPEPEAAASLAQVHRARLTSGEEVVVKVQRPRIERLVETDLSALQLAIQWLKIYRPIVRRVDLDRLYSEFATTTRAELNFIAEGQNAEQFAANCADDPSIYIADVYWQYTTRRVLTLENVASLKITDVAAIAAAGVSPAAVARKLYDTYLEQIFVHNFVHADPHPGNLFIHPLPPIPDADPAAPRPFLLIFVDFGMVAVIPERLRAGMRDYVIGLGTRDAHRVVQSYLDSGILAPTADRRRLEEVMAVLFQRLGSVKMGQLSGAAMQQAGYLWREYRDTLYELPFQFPADMLFAVRSVVILAGIASTLHPDFDPWAATVPFAERMATEQAAQNWRSGLAEISDLVRLAIRLPARLDRLLTQAERGDLVTQTALAPDASRALRRLERAVDRLTWAVATIGLLVAGMMLRASDGPGGLSTGLLIAAAAAFVWGLAHR